MESGRLEGVSNTRVCGSAALLGWADTGGGLANLVWVLRSPGSRWSQGGLGDSRLLLNEQLPVSCKV